jgi:hypothetical protein
MPHSTSTSARSSEVSGVFRALHDQRVTAAQLCATRLSGKLNGVIALMTPSENSTPARNALRGAYASISKFTLLPPRRPPGDGESDSRSRDTTIRKRVGFPASVTIVSTKSARLSSMRRATRAQGRRGLGRLCSN